MSRINQLLVAVAIALIVVGINVIVVVRETERAVLLRFGELVRSDLKPGLHFKIPLIDVVRKFDGRLLTVDERPQRFLTLEKKFLSVDSFAKWRIHNVALFYTATNGEELRASELLSQRLNNGLRNQFGERSMREVVSGERDLLMDELTQQLNEATLKEFGIEVVDVRVKRIDLPSDVSESVYARMRAEREREAREHRSKGMERAEGIRAEADREQIIIAANAYRKAEQLRGEGDAMATEIYADAYQLDPEFYSFTRSLNAYRKSFANQRDLLLIEPDSKFFSYLKSSQPPATKNQSTRSDQ